MTGKTAKEIQSVVKRDINLDLDLEQIIRMSPISSISGGKSYRILALQMGDLTVLVWMTEDGSVHRVKSVSW